MGKQPRRLALGDLTGDGHLDLVTAGTATLSVLPGVGDGSFGTATDYPTADGPAALALGDLNGDGRLDVVRTGMTSATVKGTLNVWLGTGGGKLGARVDYPVGMSPQSLALGDLDGDGKLDVVVANAGADGGWSVAVLFGKGSGALASMTIVSTERASDLALGDLNRDGKLDIVVGDDWGTQVGVLLGKGDGTFAATLYTTTLDDAGAVTLADWDGDGMLDLVVGASTTGILFGKGDGTFASGVSYPVSLLYPAVADMNADGRPDLVVGVGPSALGVLLSLCR